MMMWMSYTKAKDRRTKHTESLAVYILFFLLDMRHYGRMMDDIPLTKRRRQEQFIRDVFFMLKQCLNKIQ